MKPRRSLLTAYSTSISHYVCVSVSKIERNITLLSEDLDFFTFDTKNLRKLNIRSTSLIHNVRFTVLEKLIILCGLITFSSLELGP